eukprot:4804291-Pyramimonas_sp.AAC.1
MTSCRKRSTVRNYRDSPSAARSSLSFSPPQPREVPPRGARVGLANRVSHPYSMKVNIKRGWSERRPAW